MSWVSERSYVPFAKKNQSLLHTYYWIRRISWNGREDARITLYRTTDSTILRIASPDPKFVMEIHSDHEGPRQRCWTCMSFVAGEIYSWRPMVATWSIRSPGSREIVESHDDLRLLLTGSLTWFWWRHCTCSSDYSSCVMYCPCTCCTHGAACCFPTSFFTFVRVLLVIAQKSVNISSSDRVRCFPFLSLR